MLCGITGSSGVLGNRLLKFDGIKFIKFKGDITNKKEVAYWIKNNKFDIFIHLAAIVPVTEVNKNYKYSKKVNFYGTLNIFNALKKYQNDNLKWFFFPSTSHVYECKKKLKIKESYKLKPISKYGKTKLLAENYIKNNSRLLKAKICVGRIFSFTDKRQKIPFLIPSLKKKLLSKEKKIQLKNLNHYRDFISILDLCRAIIFLAKKNYNGTINLASGKMIYLKNIAKKLNKKKIKINFIDSKKKTDLIADISKLRNLGFKLRYQSFLKIF